MNYQKKILKNKQRIIGYKMHFANCLLPIAYCLLLILSGCNRKQETENKEAAPVNENSVQMTDVQIKNAGIATGKIEQKNISDILKVSGSIDVPPQNMVSISVPLGGYLKSTKLLPGMHVNKGETIAIVEDQKYITLQEEYLTTKAKLMFTEAEFNRQSELNKSKATSDKIFQQTQADYTSQKVMAKSLSEKLKLIGINPDNLTENNLSRSINITSPINGFVSRVNVNIGKYANPSDILFELVNPEDIHLNLNIFEKDISKLFIEQKLIAYSNSLPEKKYPCKIILIGQDLTLDHSVEVHCHFEQYDKVLIPGMFMNAEIEVRSNMANALPSEAIVSYENKQYVFIVKPGNQYEMLEVKTGDSENGYSEIFLKDADRLLKSSFVTKGAYSLLMKMKNTSDE